MRGVLIALAGLTAFAAAALYFAPAALVANVTPVPARVWEVQGRILDGTARLAYDEHDLGRVAWQFDAAALADGALGLRWRLTGPTLVLAGTAHAGFADVLVTAAGGVEEAALARALWPYRIQLSGAIAIERLDLSFDHNLRPLRGAGRLEWQGGPVRYRLAGLGHSATLPPMAATLELADGEWHLVVKATDDPTPLIVSRLDAEGWAHIGITRRFTELAGLPWPGTATPEAVVLEVSERIL